MPLPPEDKKKRAYWAFLSYRHADNREAGRQWATWLHQRIETYDVPPDLVGTISGHGVRIPERIFPVFRDEEELPADADLATPITRALEASSCLVVLCSPRAVASVYVAHEIAHFKRIGKSDRVLAALVDGEPNASWDEGRHAAGFDPASECFPVPLRHPVDEKGELVFSERAEPIAADFRLPDGSQGWTSPEAYRQVLEDEGLGRAAVAARVEAYGRRLDLAVLKILAGILGVPLGTLTQRDQAFQLAKERRRARIFRRVAAGLGALALVAVTAGAYALVKRREADDARRLEATQRVRAEKGEARVVETLADSDFALGTGLLEDNRTTSRGIAHLARAARQSGHAGARTRLWTLLQQRAFWLPVVPAPGVAPRPPPAPEVSAAIRRRFASVAMGGKPVAPVGLGLSADGLSVAAITNGEDYDPEIHHVRVFSRNGEPRTPWRSPEIEGDLRDLASVHLSPTGRFIATVAMPWRAPQVIEVYDVEKGARLYPPVTASGASLERQGAVFTQVALVRGGVPGLVGEGPLLVTASSRGDAIVYQLDAETGDLVALAVASHRSRVMLAEVDAAREWLLSASEDGEIRLTSLAEGSSLGGAFRVGERVESVRRIAKARVRVRVEGGRSLDFQLLAPLVRRPPEGLAAGDPLAKVLQVAELADVELEKADLAHEASGCSLRVAGRRTLRVTDAHGGVHERTFPVDLDVVAFSGDGALVLTTTATLVSEVWNADLSKAMAMPVDEGRLLGGGQVPREAYALEIDPASGVLLTWSHFWDPPNVAFHWFTLWDSHSGFALSDRAEFVDMGFEDSAVAGASLGPVGGSWLLHHRSLGGDPLPVSGLELAPPAVALPWLPDLAEAVGGLRLDGSSNPLPVADRVTALHRLLAKRALLDQESR